jgi:UDP-N-acetylglucosamine 4,6-dehydratase/5-epimerase
MVTEKQLFSEFRGKKILVTGGSGSVGKAIVKEIIKYKPSAVRIFTNDENSIFEMNRSIGKNSSLTYVVGDIRDVDRVKLAIRDIDIVFHAAAMKHVDICEANPFDAVKTNVVGTSNMIEASLLENISKFIFISTDKATNPSTTLGASKLLAERITQDAGYYRGIGKTIFSIVRFGNVLGSRGSVFQIFLDNLKHNETLTVTDKRMTRFIMSLSDAANLILKVSVIAKDGEVHILKMPSVRIIDLAKSMIKVFQIKYKKFDKKIIIGTIRDKEKLHEYLITQTEIQYCHNLGSTYKISKKFTKKEINVKEISSETTQQISEKELDKLINQLMNES